MISLSPSFKIKAGVWYLDRVKIKILPAGGIVWTPNADVYFDILFPNPKVAKRLTTWGNTEWWLYAAGEYGGGTWTIKRKTGFAPPGGPVDGSIDTVRLQRHSGRRRAGVQDLRQLHGYFEVGLSCSRELVYQSGLTQRVLSEQHRVSRRRAGVLRNDE